MNGLAWLREQWQKRWVRGVTWGLSAALGLYALAGFWLLPAWARPYAEREVSTLLGRTVRIEAMSFNPFLLRARINGVQIAERDATQTFLRFDSLMVDAQIASLWSGGPVIREVQLVGPWLQVRRQRDGQFNFSDILARLQPKDAPEPEEDAAPLLFSLNNLRLSGGGLRYADEIENTQHTLEALEVALPFLSNIPTYIENFVQPHLSMRVDGSTFALDGRVKPFADRREAELDVRLAPLDLRPYLAYLPETLAWRPNAGRLETDARIVWSQASDGTQRVVLRGRVGVRDFAMPAPDRKPLFAWRNLQIEMGEVVPLASPVQIGLQRVTLDGLAVTLQRRRDGSLNLPPSGDDKEVSTTPPPHVKLAELLVSEAGVSWQDDAVLGGFRSALQPLRVQLSGFDSLADAPANLALEAQGSAGEKWQVSGSINPVARILDLRAQAEALKIQTAAPYLAQVMPAARLQGQVAAAAHLVLRAPPDQAASWQVDQGMLQVDGLQLAGADRKTLLRLPSLRSEDFSIEPAKHALSLGRLSSRGLRLQASRARDGSIDLLSLLAGPTPSGETQTPAAQPQATTPWLVSLPQIALSDWALDFQDASGSEPVKLAVSALTLKASQLSTRADAKGRIDLKARINQRGQLGVVGDLGLQPVRGALQLGLQDVDILAAQPYIEQRYRVLLTQGALSASGALEFDLADMATPRLHYRGSLALNDFNSLDRINNTDFLRWKGLSLAAIDLRTAPLQIGIGEIALRDFYTRLILDAQGKLNLRELASQEESKAASVASAPAAAPAASAPAVAGEASQPFPLRVGRIVLSGGDVNFSDRFIRPNYDARIAALGGEMSGLSPEAGSAADLKLEGKVDGTAPLTVAGRLNPLRQDRYLDIRASVSGVDLTTASAYAGKYVGYGIAKGSLSMDVAYRINERKLSAENRIVLNQLTLGEKVDSPDATKLPVHLALALLKDRDGNIDINLPIGGSLDDPEFSVGGIVLRVFVNIIVKAVTSPFALLASLGGGGDVELSYLPFAPGVARLDVAQQDRLRKLAEALERRPALRLDVIGRSDAGDAAGLQRERMLAKLRAQKARELVRQGQAVAAVEALVIEPAEYPRYLLEAYRAEPMDKPRNVIGMLREVPQQEMEARLLANSTASEADVRALARTRAQAVRSWLVTEGKVAAERVFVVGEGAENEAAIKAGVRTRVDFSLR